MFAEVNSTNIRKSLYKKKDFIQEGEESVDIQGEGGDDDKVMYDSDGNELVKHESKNHMNDMLPINVKAA